MTRKTSSPGDFNEVFFDGDLWVGDGKIMFFFYENRLFDMFTMGDNSNYAVIWWFSHGFYLGLKLNW